MQKFYPDDAQRDLLRKKGVYPYNWMNSMEQFEETKLPNLQPFSSRLDDVVSICTRWNCLEYVWMPHDACLSYWTSDILLLVYLRILWMETYKLDPLHYYSLPELYWDALLKLS